VNDVIIAQDDSSLVAVCKGRIDLTSPSMTENYALLIEKMRIRINNMRVSLDRSECLANLGVVPGIILIAENI
jgi:hypothetical protein